MTKSLQIISLEAENVKRLKAVRIDPKVAGLVPIVGKNEAGKSSVLDAIWWALTGAKHIQAEPIRKGADKAFIKLDLGELVVERRFGGTGGTSLSVKTADGAKYTSPQRILDDLVGALAFDPLAFANAPAKEQFETLRQALGLEFDGIDAEIKEKYELRTSLNSEIKASQSAMDALGLTGDRVEEIDTDNLLGRLDGAAIRNGQIVEARSRRQRLEAQAEGLRQEAIRQADIAKQAREAMESAAKKAAGIEHEIAELPPEPKPIDVEAIRAELAKAKETNDQAAKWKERDRLRSRLDSEQLEAGRLTAAIAQLRQSKKDMIANANMPVEGLGFGDDIVTYNGLPFDQASSAIQIKTSVAMAMAANPKLRVIRIKEGSLLDDDNLAMIAEMAREGDYQIWIEIVGKGNGLGFLIEDGEVAAVDGKPVEK